jgi:ribosome-binding protein aMBF1 (putative translation factor)
VEDHPWCDRMHWRTILSMPIPSPKHALDPALVALGMAIRATRQARGLSQEELAHRSAVDRSYMSSIERGTQNPGLMVVIRIAAGIGISVAELATEAGL